MNETPIRQLFQKRDHRRAAGVGIDLEFLDQSGSQRRGGTGRLQHRPDPCADVAEMMVVAGFGVERHAFLAQGGEDDLLVPINDRILLTFRSDSPRATVINFGAPPQAGPPANPENASTALT